MHPIRQYCRDHEITQREFADQVAFSDGFISALISGADKCGRNAGLQIQALTDGEISLGELLTYQPDASEPAA